MLILLVVCISSISAIASIGYYSGRQNLSNSIFNQLISVRESKAHEIETYFKTLRSQVKTFSTMPSVVSTMKELKIAYGEIADNSVSPNWNNQVIDYYTSEFLPRLKKNVKGVPLLYSYLPQKSAARYLQYQYIANNPNSIGKKGFLVDAKDGSKYNQVHQKIQSIYRNFIEQFGYYDMFLIDIDSGNIVYSVQKETDFGTNLDRGPYARSGLAEVLQAVRKGKDPGFVAISDFEPYRPSYAAPAAFIASPITDNFQVVGVLALQISIDQINKVMTDNQNWQEVGLGNSGETYLVGADHGMRSTSRFLIEDPQKYFKAITHNGLPKEEINQIKKLETSIFHQRVNTEAVKQALLGETDTNIGLDYRGVTTLNAYKPLEISNLDWAVIAQIDRKEAFAPISQFQRLVLFSTSILVLLVTAIAAIYSHFFVRPIRKLIDSFQKVGSGRTDIKVTVRSKDEFRQMANSFNEMVDNLHRQQQLVKTREQENDKLLLSILPEPVANRLKQGEEVIADSFPNVTVLFADLGGFTEIANQLPALETIALLNEVIVAFDEAAELFGVEKIKTIGSGYMAVSGLTVPRIDHSKRVVDFALEMIRILHCFNRDHQTNFSITAGVNVGEVLAGVVGKEKFIYDLWGDTVNVAHRLQAKGEDDVVYVTKGVYGNLTDIYEFKSLPDIVIPNKENIPIWSVTLG